MTREELFSRGAGPDRSGITVLNACTNGDFYVLEQFCERLPIRPVPAFDPWREAPDPDPCRADGPRTAARTDCRADGGVSRSASTDLHKIS